MLIYVSKLGPRVGTKFIRDIYIMVGLGATTPTAAVFFHFHEKYSGSINKKGFK